MGRKGGGKKEDRNEVGGRQGGGQEEWQREE
jgi:hypothetical protein